MAKLNFLLAGLAATAMASPWKRAAAPGGGEWGGEQGKPEGGAWGSKQGEGQAWGGQGVAHAGQGKGQGEEHGKAWAGEHGNAWGGEHGNAWGGEHGKGGNGWGKTSSSVAGGYGSASTCMPSTVTVTQPQYVTKGGYNNTSTAYATVTVPGKQFTSINASSKFTDILQAPAPRDMRRPRSTTLRRLSLLLRAPL